MGSSVKFGKFKWNRPGYAQLMDSAPVQAVISRKASAVKVSADAAVAASYPKAEGAAHAMSDFQGELARGKVIRTNNFAASYGEAKQKTLSKSLGAANG